MLIYEESIAPLSDQFEVKIGRYDHPEYRKLLEGWDPTTGQL